MAFRKTNSNGREYEVGKPLGNDYRRALVDKLKELGADEVSRSIPYGVISKCAREHKVDRSTVTTIWERYCDTGSVSPKKCPGNKLCKKLWCDDLRYIELMKTETPSMTYREIQRKLEENANVIVSEATICRAVRHRLLQGKWTRKKMIRPARERFSQANLMYTQAYLNVLHNIDPMRLRFFDESGFTLQTSNRTYGHSPIGLPAVEIQRYNPGASFTLNLLVSPFGVAHANVVQGPSNTDRYLQFFSEAAETVMENALSALSPGDVVVVDNCPTHHNRGGDILSQFLDNLGIEYIFTPTYSPDFNAAEFAFRCLKTIFKRPFYQRLALDNMEYAILRAVTEITPGQCLEFFRSVGYLVL
ncbi:uncharacterized protein [Ptychodera flava]|uniref:uncharacterized protein n=1 Tax=Ptychodera flava TaxID=63121 RepID=UPI003969E875